MSFRNSLTLSTIIGLVLSVLVVGASFALRAAGVPLVFDFVLRVSLPTIGLFSTIVPSSLVYWVFPDGGPNAATALLLGAAVFQQALVFGAVAFLAIRMRSIGAPRPGAPEASHAGQPSRPRPAGRER